MFTLLSYLNYLFDVALSDVHPVFGLVRAVIFFLFLLCSALWVVLWVLARLGCRLPRLKSYAGIAAVYSVIFLVLVRFVQTVLSVIG